MWAPVENSLFMQLTFGIHLRHMLLDFIYRESLYIQQQLLEMDEQ